MPELWYVKDQGQELGPMGFLFLKILAEEGKITPETPVRQEKGPWTTAGQVEGVFTATPSAEQAPKEKEPAVTSPASSAREAAWAARAAGRSERAPATPPSSSPSQGGGRWVVYVAIMIVLGIARVGCKTDRTSYTPPTWNPPEVQPWHDDHVRKILEDIERQKRFPAAGVDPEIRKELEKLQEREKLRDPNDILRKLKEDLDKLNRDLKQGPMEKEPPKRPILPNDPDDRD